MSSECLAVPVGPRYRLPRYRLTGPNAAVRTSLPPLSAILLTPMCVDESSRRLMPAARPTWGSELYALIRRITCTLSNPRIWCSGHTSVSSVKHIFRSIGASESLFSGSREMPVYFSFMSSMVELEHLETLAGLAWFTTWDFQVFSGTLGASESLLERFMGVGLPSDNTNPPTFAPDWIPEIVRSQGCIDESYAVIRSLHPEYDSVLFSMDGLGKMDLVRMAASCLRTPVYLVRCGSRGIDELQDVNGAGVPIDEARLISGLSSSEWDRQRVGD